MTKPKVRNRKATQAKAAAVGITASTVGARLRELRKQRQISQGDIERRTGLLRCYVSRVEGGYTVPSVDTLEKFAAALAVPLHSMFQGGRMPAGSTAATPKVARSLPVDPYFEKLRRFTARMDAQDQDLFLSLVRKIAITAA